MRLITGRRSLLVITALAGLVLAGYVLGRSRLEGAVRERLVREAAAQGLVLQVDSVRVGPWPPLRIEGLRLTRSGGWSLVTDRADVTLRVLGRGLVGRARIALGPSTLTGPGQLDVQAVPTQWDVERLVPRGVRLRCCGTDGALELAWRPAGAGDEITLRAAELPAGRLFQVRHAGMPLVDAGVLDATFRLTRAKSSVGFDLSAGGRDLRVASLSGEAVEGQGPAFGEPTDFALKIEGAYLPAAGVLEIPRWRVMAGGASARGSLDLADLPGQPRLDLSLQVERVDFARLLQTSGLDDPKDGRPGLPMAASPADLGSASLSARVRGRVDEAAFTVTQKLDFTPPRQIPPALTRLRGDFTHPVVPSGGEPRSIAVSPASPDFIALREVPPVFVRTLLLAEDAGFFGHHGVDLGELPAAIVTNWTRGGAFRGASTITQQVAKNLFLSREKRLGRKLQELCLALLLEATLSKERILEIYLNVIEWGPDLYGLRPAAHRYFHKEPAELTPKQMAFLVALIPGPVKYQRSIVRGTLSPGFRPLVDDLLGKVCRTQVLTESECEEAQAEELFVDTSPATLDGGETRR